MGYLLIEMFRVVEHRGEERTTGGFSVLHGKARSTPQTFSSNVNLVNICRKSVEIRHESTDNPS